MKVTINLDSKDLPALKKVVEQMRWKKPYENFVKECDRVFAAIEKLEAPKRKLNPWFTEQLKNGKL